MNPLPSNTVTADQQAGHLIRQSGDNTPGCALGKAVRQLVEGVAVVRIDMNKAHIGDLPGNEQQGRTHACKLNMATDAPKRLGNIRREQRISGNAHTAIGA